MNKEIEVKIIELDNGVAAYIFNMTPEYRQGLYLSGIRRIEEEHVDETTIKKYRHAEDEDDANAIVRFAIECAIQDQIFTIKLDSMGQ